MNKMSFNSKEKSFLVKISIIVGIVEFTMALMNPFITLYGTSLSKATPQLVGLALGIYGLMQAIFQIPYGYLSDRYGRKPIVAAGLIQMTLGLILSFSAKNIFIFIIARALLGSGAILGVSYSWVGDFFSNDKKNKAMGTAGMVVGAAAAVAFGLGPILREVISISSMFLISAVLVAISMLVVIILMTEGKDRKVEIKQKEKTNYKEVLNDKNLYRIFFNGMLMDYMLFSTYYIVPLVAKPYIGESGMWKIFFPATVVGIISIRITSKSADKLGIKKIMVTLFLIALLGVALFLMKGIVPIIAGMIFFMAGFMGLKVLLPSTVNLLTKKTYRGITNGILNTCIFIGTFLGGSVTGLLWKYGKTTAVIILMSAAAAGIIVSLNVKERKSNYRSENQNLKGAQHCEY